MKAVAVAFACIEDECNPNLGRGRRFSASDLYYRAIVVCLSSFRRWNPDLSLRLITTDAVPEGYRATLSAIGAEIQFQDFHHRPPLGFNSGFGASLYLLDAFRLQPSHETRLYVDPDVLCVDRVTSVFQNDPLKVGVLPLQYSLDHDINGLSLRGAADIHAELGEGSDCAPIHFGGEVYLIPSKLVPPIIRRAEGAWRLSIDRFKRGEAYFSTEEHILSYAIQKLPTISLESSIRRIWTASRWRTVTGEERSLVLWHLPAEKNRGFQELYHLALDNDSWFWRASRREFVWRCGRSVGLWNRRPSRWLSDGAGKMVGLLQEICRGSRFQGPEPGTGR